MSEKWYSVPEGSFAPGSRRELDELLAIGLAVRRAYTGFVATHRRTRKGPWHPVPPHDLDMLAEGVIREYVERNDLDLNVLSEDLEPLDRGAKRTLVADPVDGTFNASCGIPLCSVSLATGGRSTDEMDAALVMNLAVEEVYWATSGGGAYLNGVRLDASRPAGRKRSVGLHLSHLATKRSFRVAGEVERVRAFGAASLELCYVAKGVLDVFYQEGVDLRLVDVAAGVLIVREAGGVVLDGTGRELMMPLEQGVTSPLIAARTRELASMISEAGQG